MAVDKSKITWNANYLDRPTSNREEAEAQAKKNLDAREESSRKTMEKVKKAGPGGTFVISPVVLKQKAGS